MLRWMLSVEPSATTGAQKQGGPKNASKIARFVVRPATHVFLQGLTETSRNALVTQINWTPREAPNALEQLISLLHILKSCLEIYLIYHHSYLFIPSMLNKLSYIHWCISYVRFNNDVFSSDVCSEDQLHLIRVVLQ